MSRLTVIMVGRVHLGRGLFVPVVDSISQKSFFLVAYVALACMQLLRIIYNRELYEIENSTATHAKNFNTGAIDLPMSRTLLLNTARSPRRVYPPGNPLLHSKRRR